MIHTEADMKLAREWGARLQTPSDVPFGMTVGGRKFLDYIDDPNVISRLETYENGPRKHVTLTWTDDATGLRVRCAGVIYSDFPVVEWTIRIKNTGDADSPMIENIRALDCSLPGEYTLHRNYGDNCKADSYRPLTQKFEPGAPFVIAPPKGRPCDADTFPYFGLEAASHGVLFAIGWGGQWEASFEQVGGGDGGESQSESVLHVTAGQQLTHFRLKPGEEARSPLMAVLLYDGDDYLRGMNLWRRWMMAHNSPFEGRTAPSGKCEPEFIHAFCATPFSPGLKSSAAVEKLFAEELIKQDSKPDYWWMDAGWYPCGDDWNRPGTWFTDPERFPGGIRDVSDFLHERGIKAILWCEPERALPESWLAVNHPEWLRGILLDLGNKDAWNWVLEHFDNLITREGIDLYRQDFGMHPLRWYRLDEPEDRQGLAENFHIQGYYAFWDELLRRHPGMLIDSCASGGRRNDIETLRRAVPLLRSDYQTFDGDVGMSVGNQGHTYGLSQWIPYHGHGVYYNNEHFIYSVRSYLSPAIVIPVDVRRTDIDWDIYRKANREWREVCTMMCSDFYPLLPYNIDEDKWLAWQYDRPENGDGFVLAFRRFECGEKSLRLRLRALDRGTTYIFTDADTGEMCEMTGGDAADRGLTVESAAAPGSKLIKYNIKT